jgi:hypothetical protein
VTRGDAGGHRGPVLSGSAARRRSRSPGVHGRVVTREALVWIGEPLTRWGYRVGARLTAPPRFHASYCEYEATIIIAAFQPRGGKLLARALRLVQKLTGPHRAGLHRAELKANSDAARARLHWLRRR